MYCIDNNDQLKRYPLRDSYTFNIATLCRFGIRWFAIVFRFAERNQIHSAAVFASKCKTFALLVTSSFAENSFRVNAGQT